MNQYVKESRTEIFSPTFKEYKEDLKALVETNSIVSKSWPLKQIRTIHCNSLLAEETITVIIDYFKEQSHLSNDFRKSILNEIKYVEFANPNENQKLESSIKVNAEHSFKTSANGMKNILSAFKSYSDLTSNSNNDYFEDINYVVESSFEVYDSSRIWAEQAIDGPWYK